MENRMPLEWSDYVKLALASSAVSSVIALAHSSWKDGRAHKRDARDSALTAALVLEQYARDCRSMMYKASPAAEEAARTQSYDPVEDIGLPQFQFPGEIEWKWLNHKNAVALREFPAMLLSARRFLGATYEFEDPVIYAEELEFQCAKAAKKAL
ncbi:MAG TPA: hypothetical protein VNZ04_03630, partial [Trinickia sp.]|nr:hypothetical protein [Trinickia sp.]